ncbi:MAG: hypothetical protein Q9169_008568, partial [Polycauliona sp. 2 TL-2023]
TNLESRGIFWSKNKFIIDYLWGLSYFSYGLGPERLRYINCVGILWYWNPWPSRPTNEDAAWQTEWLLGPRYYGLGVLMSSITYGLSQEYGFVHKVLAAVQRWNANHNTKLDRYRHRTAKIERKQNEDDRTAIAVLEASGSLRDSADILGEAILSHREGEVKRLKRNRRG